MLHAVTLTYRCPEEKLAAWLDAHKQWLVKGIKQGEILFAGPLDSHAGGFILFHGDKDQVNRSLKEDPFVEHQLVDVDMVSVEPALGVQDFPVKWAEKAKLI